MNWQFTARSPAELAKIGKALFNASKQNVLDEQVQMTRLLESLARTEILHYPIRVCHTGINSVPDFQLESGGRRIGVEITKVAVPDVEHARALQNKGLNSTLGISSLYRKENKPRRKEKIIAEGFGIPTFVFPVSLDEHDTIWIEAAEASLTTKSAVIARPDFQRGDENWLVLWDRIATADWELGARQATFAGLLCIYWKPGWFSHVFLQDCDFFWQAMFTPSESTLLPSHRAKI
jgi:hypothetical protein